MCRGCKNNLSQYDCNVTIAKLRFYVMGFTFCNRSLTVVVGRLIRQPVQFALLRELYRTKLYAQYNIDGFTTAHITHIYMNIIHTRFIVFVLSATA